MTIYEKGRTITNNQRIVWGLVGMSFFIILWAITTKLQIISPTFLPSPNAVIHALVILSSEFGLWSDVITSLYRIILGFLLSVSIAIPLGILLGVHKHTSALFEPLLSFARYIPPSAFVPLFILWFGIGDLQKIILIFVGIVPYLTLLTVDAVLHTRKELLETAYVLGCKNFLSITKVVIPNSLPGIWDATRLMFGAAWTFVVLAEIVASTSGIGHLIIVSQRFLQTENVIAAIVIIGLLGLITDFLFKFGYKLLFPWTDKSTNYAYTQ